MPIPGGKNASENTRRAEQTAGDTRKKDEEKATKLRERIWREVRLILADILQNMKPQHKDYENVLNERYLHHYFSHRYQQRFTGVDLIGVDGIQQQEHGEEIALHPEWPTSKKASGIAGGMYAQNRPDPDGSAGHIDFAIGRYEEPWLGIEFKLSNGWPGEGVQFDLVKLLDPNNRFRLAVSFNVLIRDKLSGQHNGIEDAIKKAYKEAVTGAGSNQKTPRLWYIVVEVDPKERRIFLAKTDGPDKATEAPRITKLEGTALVEFLHKEWKP
ncbi:MAG: hypothetical protein C4523_14215 [Myxococcales bacterium]|nr:MAG: hypothetical protein C4523_14215 [Myxococcales bacterium]